MNFPVRAVLFAPPTAVSCLPSVDRAARQVRCAIGRLGYGNAGRRFRGLASHALPRPLSFLLFVVVAGLIHVASATAQHGPDCEEIFPAGLGLRPREVQPQGDLSFLQKRERQNVTFYVADKMRRGQSVPKTVWLLHLPWVVDRPRYTLIFEEGPAKAYAVVLRLFLEKTKTVYRPFPIESILSTPRALGGGSKSTASRRRCRLLLRSWMRMSGTLSSLSISGECGAAYLKEVRRSSGRSLIDLRPGSRDLFPAILIFLRASAAFLRKRRRRSFH